MVHRSLMCSVSRPYKLVLKLSRVIGTIKGWVFFLVLFNDDCTLLVSKGVSWLPGSVIVLKLDFWFLDLVFLMMWSWIYGKLSILSRQVDAVDEEVHSGEHYCDVICDVFFTSRDTFQMLLVKSNLKWVGLIALWYGVRLRDQIVVKSVVFSNPILCRELSHTPT